MSNKANDLYDVLNLSKNCNADDIKKSFIKLSKEFHPDKNNSKDAHERFVRINEAYTTLINPTKRKQYDYQMSVRRNYDFNASGGSQDSQFNWRKYDYSSYKYNHSKESSNSHSGSRFLMRLMFFPKAVIVTALVLVTFFSSGLEIYFLKRASDKRNKIMEEKSIIASLILEEAQRQAKLMGNEKQMERLKEGKLGVSDTDILVYQYMKARDSRRHKSN